MDILDSFYAWVGLSPEGKECLLMTEDPSNKSKNIMAFPTEKMALSVEGLVQSVCNHTGLQAQLLKFGGRRVLKTLTKSKKDFTLIDLLSESEIVAAKKLPNAVEISEKVVAPVIDRINKATDQMNDPLYIAYLVQYLITKEEHKGK